MKRVIALVLLVAFVVVLGAGVGLAADKKYHWKIGHIRPEGTAVDKDVKWFVEQITSGSNGRITFDIYPASQLGDYTVVQERCGMGDVDMYLACLGTTVDKRVGIYSTPYLVKNWAEAKTVYSMDSVLQKAVGRFLEAQGIKMIAGWPVYFGGIITLVEPP
nr:TRAP transporter substrate-binding protein DctP [Synergistales bacterium]